MRWLIAPTALKGSLTAKDAAEVIAHALKESIPHVETIICPIADGGTDTLMCLVDGTKGRYFSSQVTGPFPHMLVNARFGVLGDGITAVIAIDEVVGLHLLKPHQYDAMHATTYGVGELIKRALDLNFRKFFITLGGSATVDGGAGCLQALGMRLLDEEGKELPFGGAYLSRLKILDASLVDPRLLESHVSLLSDVTAILCGEEGAAHLFAAQKGATSDQIHELDHALQHFGQILFEHFSYPIFSVLGGGAAGGLAAGLAAVCQAPICLGIDVILDILDFNDQLASCDGVITGEGKLDAQTSYGKAIQGVSSRAEKLNKPVHVFVGKIEGDPALLKKKFHLASLHQISPPSLSYEQAVKEVKHLLHQAVVTYFTRCASFPSGKPHM